MPVTVDDLPSSIRVGPHDIKITQAPSIDNGNSYGQFSLDAQEIILIREFNSPTLAVDTFLHELLHAAWRTMSLPKRGEESAVAALSTCLTQVFRDHPEILAWLQKTLARK